jgi:hypothetical protein
MNPIEITNYLHEQQELLKILYAEGKNQIWSYKPEGKWTGGQHLVHLVQSTEPLLKALGYPKFILKWKFGTNNRENRSFDTIVSRYKEKLSQVPGGVVSPFSQKMPSPTYEESGHWLEKWEQQNNSLNVKTMKLKESQLDSVLVPHPLMGRMTLREILMWNGYHAHHHYTILKEKYLGK